MRNEKELVIPLITGPTLNSNSWSTVYDTDRSASSDADEGGCSNASEHARNTRVASVIQVESERERAAVTTDDLP